MKLRIAVDLSFSGVGICSELRRDMSDWIDKLKTADEKNAKIAHEEKKFRLQVAEIISAKAPEFWHSLGRQLKADVAKLNETFANDSCRQCDLIDRQHDLSYVIQSRKLPFTIIRLSTNFSAQQIVVEKGIKKSREHQPDFSLEPPMSFTLDSANELQLEWQGTKYSDTALLAEKLIKSVIGSV
jgi:hypothetical protein